MTRFHNCGGGRIYMSMKSVNQIDGKNYFLANTQVIEPKDTVDLVVRAGFI